MRAESARGQTQFLDRLVRLLALVLAVCILGFAVYYYWDRRANPGPSFVDRAIEQAEQAVRSDPSDPGARVVLGDLLLNRGRYTDAIAQFNAALELDDKFGRAHRGLGLAYLQTGQFTQAEQEFQNVIDSKKDSQFAKVDRGLEEAYYFMARVQVNLKKPDVAVEDLKHALGIDNTDADAWELLGSTYLAMGKPEEATKALKKAVLFVPKFEEAYQALAEAYRAVGDEQGMRYAQAMALYSEGAYDQAVKELQAVTQAKPDFWDAWSGLGLAYEAKLQNKEAAEAYQKALAGNPEDFTARTGLVRLGVVKP